MTSPQASLSSDLIIRPATAGDLPRLWEIRAASDAPDPTNAPPAGPAPAILGHLLRTGTLLLAERGGHIVGFGGRADRGGIAFLTDLFVDPALQSAAVGKTLLQDLFQGVGARRCTLASSDARAVALYTRAGMAPRWPNLDLFADSARLRLTHARNVSLRPADPLDPTFLDWDSVLGGRRRPQDFAFFRDEQDASFFWIDSATGPVGYAVVRRDSVSGVRDDTLTIGPVGGRTVAAARAGTLAAVAWAQVRAPRLEITVPGPHSALRELLEAGFLIDYIGTFCASAPVRLNPARYIASGGDLF
jgi:ribosomal protein S18 acetylase RimI-like enzyme